MNLISVSFFKKVMTVLLEMHTTGAILSKICLKAIIVTFFSNM